MQAAFVFDEYGFPRLHVTDSFELQHVERHALGGDHVLGCNLRPPRAQHERADTVRVAKGDNAESDDQRNHGIAAPAPSVQCVDRIEHLFGRRPAIRAHL